jgi:fibronectin-binding autotransporter adhesin
MPISAPRDAYASPVLAVTLCLLAALASSVVHADCATGNGVLTTPGVCTTPQTLTGATGTIASGVMLSTGTSGPAYTVSSSNAAVTNSGTVTTLRPEAFLINGPAGSSTTLTNSGSITSAQGTAIIVSGNPNNNLNLINSGTIIGGAGTALNYMTFGNPVSRGTIIQSAGTIDGTILLSGLQTVLTVTGGTINGSILDRTPASGAAGSSQGRGGLINFDLGAGSFTTNGDISVGAVNVRSGTLVLGNDVYVSGGINGVGLTNNARLQINGVRTLIGNFVQNASGTLVMQVSPVSSSQLNVRTLPFFGGGTASLAGTLVLAYEPGVYSARTYTLLSATTAVLSGGVTGGFSTVSGTVPTPGLTQSVSVGPNPSIWSSAQSPAAKPSRRAKQWLLRRPTTRCFSAVTTTAILNAQWASRMLLDRWGSGRSGTTSLPSVTRLTPPGKSQTALSGSATAMDAVVAALPETMARYGGWFWGSGNFVSLNGSTAAPGFAARSGGFLAGIDQPVGDETWAGAAAGYGHTGLSEHAPSSGDMDTARVAFYGGTRLGPTVLSATTGFAHDWITTARPLTGIGTAQEGHGGQEVTAAAQASLPLDIGGVRVTPRAGVQFVNLFESSFAETGANGFNLSNRGRGTDSLQPYFATSSWRSFATDQGSIITPEVRLGYTREALSNSRLVTVATVTGADFPVQGVKPSKNMLTAGVGVTLQAQDNVYLYADYDAVAPTGNTAYQVVSAGLRIKF